MKKISARQIQSYTQRVSLQHSIGYPVDSRGAMGRVGIALLLDDIREPKHCEIVALEL
jgi:hypothetical protein